MSQVFNCPADADHTNFGYSPVGEDGVEARRYLSTVVYRKPHAELSDWV